MTVFGKHTIAEIRELAATVEFRIRATEALIKKHPNIDPGVVDTWQTWKGRWRRASDAVLPAVTLRSLSSPLVPASAMAAEDEWMKLKCAINKTCDETHNPGDMFDSIQVVETAAGERIDERNAPQPDANDPDLNAFKALDSAIKKGEAAAEEAKKAGGAVASKVPWWVWAGGVGVLGVFVWGETAPMRYAAKRLRD